MRGRAVPGALLALPLLLASQAPAQLADPIPEPIAPGAIAVELEEIATGLTAPNALTHAGDGSGRLFVVDQPGQVRIIGPGGLTDEPFLDVSDRLLPPSLTDSERGLLGLAFHPEFGEPTSPFFGALYTYTSEPVDGPADFTTSVPLPPGQAFDHQSVVAEWRVDAGDPSRVDEASRREVLRIDQPQTNHNGGVLAFGPDSLLYVGLGDGGAAGDTGPGHGSTGTAQDTSNVLGSILRIDPGGTNGVNGAYGVPATNPLVGEEGLDEIFAYGFRNPFRISFDRETGDLVAGDVGQGDIEEIDIVFAGGNYGWNP